MPAVALLGPRQVGKTTLARAIADELGAGALYLDLERPADRRKLEDADAYLRAAGRRLCVIDEVQRAPGLFEILRGVIDDRRAAGDRSGHFLLLGSASLDLMRQASESLAGRIARVEMEPVGVRDASVSGITTEDLWVRGGFPESLIASRDAESLLWRTDFIRSYLERDVPLFAPRMPAETLGRLWTMLAHSQGAPLNAARLASSLDVSAPAIARYVDLLVDLLLVRRLRSWSGNVRRRLVRAPRTYVRDSGIVQALLGLSGLDQLWGIPWPARAGRGSPSRTSSRRPARAASPATTARRTAPRSTWSWNGAASSRWPSRSSVRRPHRCHAGSTRPVTFSSLGKGTWFTPDPLAGRVPAA